MTDPVIRIVDDDPRMHDALQFVLESAERLELAVRTVEFHRAGAMRKLGTHSAKELTEKLIAAGALGS